MILSTAGAVPVKDEKGQTRMEKTKVSRYFAGKRPEYAPAYLSEEEDEVACKSFCKRPNDASLETCDIKAKIEMEAVGDRRLQRLMEIRNMNEEDDEISKNLKSSRRKVEVMEIKEEAEHVMTDSEVSEDEIQLRRQILRSRTTIKKEEVVKDVIDIKIKEESEPAETEEEELSEDEIQRRREILRKRATVKKEEEGELMEFGEEISKEEENQEESEYEECSDSEPEEDHQRLKPVFVRKENRVTIIEREKLFLSKEELEALEIKGACKKRESTLHLLELDLKREAEANARAAKSMEEVITDDENEEESYHIWRLRELTRYKRDKEEREKQLKEKEELERQRNMTEEERLKELESNPKIVTNKLDRGKYKFLQKYYHRGAFYLDEENDLLKRDITAPTLEDHFDKTVLPKALQVKNFGRIGQTKYTHLLDQDTTKFDSPWAIGKNLELHKIRRGGMKEPEAKRARIM